MAEYDLKYLQKQMKEALSEDRFEHTIGVMYTAESLAMRYGVDMTKAAVAGLLHDCAKCIPNAQKMKMCKKMILKSQKWKKRIHPYYMQNLVHFLQKICMEWRILKF